MSAPVKTPHWGTLAAAVAVACAAGATTAHGLYEVARAADVPRSIAWLYPLITDGLALVAYAATSRLGGAGRRYAWLVVVLAAGVSGVAQATYLAVGVAGAPPGLRFGIGAWPAIAAAIVAHLLFLLGTSPGRPAPVQAERSVDGGVVQPVRSEPGPVVQQSGLDAVQPEPSTVYKPAAGLDAAVVQPDAEADRGAGSYGGGPARERAYEVAAAHAAEHGSLPTVSELMAMAEVSRGTAGAALKDLRDQRPSLHVVLNDTARTTS